MATINQLDENAGVRKLKEMLSKIDGEAVTGGRCVLAMRRAALQRLLDEERRQHCEELARMGLSFHRERM